MAFLKAGLEGQHVATFRAECTTILSEGFGLRAGDRGLLERLLATGVQPYRYSRERGDAKGLAVMLRDQDWRQFEVIRRRFCSARHCHRLRQSRAAHRTH